MEATSQRKDVIESRRRDYESGLGRGKAWTEITTSFNVNFPASTDKQLKDLWRRVKISAKSESAAAKKSRSKTNGGRPIQQLT